MYDVHIICYQLNIFHTSFTIHAVNKLIDKIPTLGTERGPGDGATVVDIRPIDHVFYRVVVHVFGLSDAL